MAHFAKVENGIVTQVVRVSDEHEHRGQEYLNEIGLIGTWIQTSFNSNFRGKFAGIGDQYFENEDVFRSLPYYPSWVWDSETSGWVAPVALPEDAKTTENPDGVLYRWDEDSVSWAAVEAD